MFINKIIKNSSIKNVLIASLLLSSIAISQNSQASFLIQKKTSVNKASVQKLILVSAGILAIYVLFKCNTAANRSPNEANIIENFNNHNDFARLEREALQEYINNTWFPSDDSLESDYPAQRLKKDAESNKKYMKFMGLFSKEKNKLANRLQNSLRDLNNNPVFRENKRKFNKENRKQKYRDAKLREGNVQNAEKITEILGQAKKLFF